MKGKKKEIYDSGLCKLCHNTKDTLKKQFNDPEEHWEKKICPNCGDDAWIYHGKRPEIIAQGYNNAVRNIAHILEESRLS